jgi:hypothetical protein
LLSPLSNGIGIKSVHLIESWSSMPGARART